MGKLIERYLHGSQQLRAVFLLIDIRHEPGANDKIMYEWICHNGYEPIIIATKLDKIKRSQIQKQVKLIREGLKSTPGHTDHSVFFRDEAGSGGSVESDGVVMFCGREAGRNAGRGMMKRTKIRLYGCGNAI